jgi:hypothetical protein
MPFKIEAAATQWGVDASSCRAQHGVPSCTSRPRAAGPTVRSCTRLRRSLRRRATAWT